GDPNGTSASLSVPESIGLNGTGINNTGALRNVSGNNTWTGHVVLVTDDAIGVDAGTQLTVAGGSADVQDHTVVTVPAASLTKVGQGILNFPQTNTYSGKTFVDDGVLN